MRSPDFSGKQVVEMCPGVTYRQLDHWCRHGLFGPTNQDPGSGSRRRFTAEDLAVVRAISDVAGEVGIGIYRRIAEQVRDGATQVVIRLGERSKIVVELDDDTEAVPA